ncbi:hypothetical protein CCH79_00018645 [Gambusia affinis]|uniref:Peptidase S1 domain-containing protein n=1 Tax=Gambusia affinis TaxID=33528 RepID=A0A315V824_GAMAF|nr:hypothetical protein CCH79_00018645 [Gambusia affinis]
MAVEKFGKQAESSGIAKEQQKKYYDQKAKDQVFSPGDRVLVKICHVEGRQKLGDKWEPRPYIVVKKQPPVYVVQPEDGGPERVVHRNLLTQCMFILVEEVGKPIAEEEESDLDLNETGLQADLHQNADAVSVEETGPSLQLGEINQKDKQASQVEEDTAGENKPHGSPESLQSRGIPRKNPPRTRCPPKKLSYGAQRRHQIKKGFENSSLWTIHVGLTEQLIHGAHSLAVKRIIHHPQYWHKGLDYDIALMRLQEPLVFDGLVQPICLPNYGKEITEGTMCWISGWGATEEDGESSVVLHSAMIPLISTKTCNQADVYKGLISSWMICAGYLEGGIDSCQGDLALWSDSRQCSTLEGISADHDSEFSSKTKGGGGCFCIDNGWCSDVTVIV